MTEALLFSYYTLYIYILGRGGANGAVKHNQSVLLVHGENFVPCF